MTYSNLSFLFVAFCTLCVVIVSFFVLNFCFVSFWDFLNYYSKLLHAIDGCTQLLLITITNNLKGSPGRKNLKGRDNTEEEGSICRREMKRRAC